MSKSEIIKFLILRTIGNFLVLFAIFGVFATFGPSLYYEAKFRVDNIRGVRYVIADPAGTIVPKPVSKGSPLGELIRRQQGTTEQILIPKDTDFNILIPKIGINSLVIPNIDSSNPDEFLPVLQRGAAHAKGTVFPGMPGNTYLFAHSTDNFWNVGRYNAIFYLLKDLTVGDDVVIFFENRRFNYVVTQTVITEGDDVSYLTKSQETGGEHTLILQTCWPPGTTWKRLLVFAKMR